MKTAIDPSPEADVPQPVPVRTAKWVVFSLDAGRYALPLERVERIVRAVEVTWLPSAPAIVLGAINVAGSVLPVFNMRRRFGLPERVIGPEDQFLIARGTHRTVVLAIDATQGVLERAVSDTVDARSIVMGLRHIQGVIRLLDGLALIHDLDLFLTAEESLTLDQVLRPSSLHAS